MKKIFKLFLISTLALSAVSCEGFLSRPSEDSFTVSDFYKNDSQIEQGVNYLYSSPWYDVIRFFIYGSETMCGNVYQGAEGAAAAYAYLTLNGTDADLKNMSYSLWAVNAQCNTVINNIRNAGGNASEARKNEGIGEALTWKAMAYFMLVRTFGDVPIIHDNTEVIKNASYNGVSKVQKEDVYEYICMTLEKAMELLPKKAYIGEYNRIDYYAAEALLAKVYLTRAGVSGELNAEHLKKAAEYTEDVIKNSGRKLTPKYSDVFRLAPKVFNQIGECLISWLWTSTSGIWTCQNSIQCDVGMSGFDEFADLWGDWKGPSIDLQDLFGVHANQNPESRVDKDDRRKATMMMFGDKYDYFWQDKGGLDMYRYYYDSEYAAGTNGYWCCGTGAMYAKHLYGNDADHFSALGVHASRMCNGLPTHILRLSDIYLVYAEAKFLTNDTDTALKYVNEVRKRANATKLDAVTIKDIWKERRLELALEGDNWYDFVRRSYYDADACIADLKAQRRGAWTGHNMGEGAYSKFVTDNSQYVGPGAHTWDGSEIVYDATCDLKVVTKDMFTVPFPTEDVVLNPNVASTAEPVHVDVRNDYSYNF